MVNIDNMKNKNRSYWAGRAPSYSDVNKEELRGESRAAWKYVIHNAIEEHYTGKAPEDIHVLDIGTGPGFFAIILAEMGYKVTAVDLTPEMLSQAAENAGYLSAVIDFKTMDAEMLSLPDDRYDVVISRNLTWNLPDPAAAYSEWKRVLKPGGLMINFDSNWYSYLFDEAAKKSYESDRKKSEEMNIGDQNIGDGFDVMEEIARTMPLSKIRRPEWDCRLLSDMGFDVSADTQIWKKVWTRQEKINFSSTPLFMISAVKTRRGDCVGKQYEI